MVDFHKRILFSDEAHSWLNGYVNKQNCRIWSEANPQVYIETPLHPEKLTSLVYADKPQTLDHLEDNIRRVIADIRPQMLEKVIENWTSRLDYIRASHGSSMPEIIFKIISHDQELTTDKFIEMLEQEQDIEELEFSDSVQSKDRIMVENFTEGLSLIEKGLQILENMDSKEEYIFQQNKE
ncbi:hypothetical protein TNCV_3230461 [Trichonephila clavipes]|nr:hypothetical protein TNCV_3230461 [Trichonephila clavipes]